RGLDRLEKWLAVIANLQLRCSPLDGGHLRNGACDGRLLRLRRARYSLSYTLRGMRRGNHCEVRRQTRARDVLPRSLHERLGTIPTPREEHVVVARLQLQENTVRRVGNIEKLSALDRGILRRPLSAKLFSRSRSDIDCGEVTVARFAVVEKLYLVLRERLLLRALQSG